MGTLQPPSSPVLALAAPPARRPSKYIRRTARMSTGGKPPAPRNAILRRPGAGDNMVLDFPTRQRLAQEGRTYAPSFLLLPLKCVTYLLLVKFYAECESFVVLSGLTSLERLRNILVCYTSFIQPALLIFIIDSGFDQAYVLKSWIEHPDADFKTDTVATFLHDSGLSVHHPSFQSMGVVSGDDLLNLSLELRSPVIRIKVKDALGLDGPPWQKFRATFCDFARPVVWELDD